MSVTNRDWFVTGAEDETMETGNWTTNPESGTAHTSWEAVGKFLLVRRYWAEKASGVTPSGYSWQIATTEVSESPITLAWRKDRQAAIDIGLASLDEEKVAA